MRPAVPRVREAAAYAAARQASRRARRDLQAGCRYAFVSVFTPLALILLLAVPPEAVPAVVVPDAAEPAPAAPVPAALAWSAWCDWSYTRRVKTAISLPDDVFEAAEDLARKLGVSRSRLYSRAVAEYVTQQTESDVTERLDAVYAEVDSQLDPVLERLQLLSVGSDEW